MQGNLKFGGPMKVLIVERPYLVLLAAGPLSGVLHITARGVLFPEKGNLLVSKATEGIEAESNFTGEYRKIKEIDLPDWCEEILDVLL